MTPPRRTPPIQFGVAALAVLMLGVGIVVVVARDGTTPKPATSDPQATTSGATISTTPPVATESATPGSATESGAGQAEAPSTGESSGGAAPTAPPIEVPPLPAFPPLPALPPGTPAFPCPPGLEQSGTCVFPFPVPPPPTP